MQLVLIDCDGCPVVVSCHVWHIIGAWLCRQRLDHALAEGVCPDSGRRIAVRARCLLRERQRQALVHSIMQLREQAARPGRCRQATSPIQWVSVIAASEQLRAVSDRMLTPGPVPVRAVAQLRLLFTDGRSPLYDRHAPLTLAEALRRTLTAFDVDS